MKKNVVRAISVILALLMFISLPGCSSLGSMMSGCPGISEKAKTNVAVVFGNRKNNPTPIVNTVTAGRIINDAIVTYGSASIVTVEGKPVSVADYTFEQQSTWVSGGTIRKQQQIMRENLISTMMSAVPTSPEADTLAAISLGARSLNVKMMEENEEVSRNVLLVLDNGLATAGSMNFTKQLLRVEPEMVVQMLQEEDAVPDLNGIEVVWIGCGDVSGEQDRLNSREVNNLKAIWEAVLKTGGASRITFAPDLPSNSTVDDSYPEVSEVILLRKGEEDGGWFDDGGVTIYDETSSLKFHPDSTKLVDFSGARKLLDPYAEYLNSHPDCSLLLCGTTATAGDNYKCCVFSYSRAVAIKNLLIQMGVSESQVRCCGLGWDNDFHVPDVDENGNLTSSAPYNRAVVILDGDSELAEELMETGYTA